jgi:serine/threonine protein kinase
MGKKYNHKIDVWSFGILCYEIIFGLYMFRPKNKNLEDEEMDEQYLINMKQPIEDPSD